MRVLTESEEKEKMKKRVMVLFGGRSSEHEISIVSGATVAKAIPEDRYDKILVGITKEGAWLLAPSVESMEDGSWKDSRIHVVLSPETDRTLLLIEGDKITRETVDVAFPVLHGLWGEDGTVQGLFATANLPYVGCGLLSSAVTMDKFFTKVIADGVGVAQAAWVPVRSWELEDMDKVVAKIESCREYPVFVKPSNAGSSVGVTKAHNREELKKGLLLAADNDSKILVEEAIAGREIECAVFGYGDDAFASGVGEILAAAEFYDYDAKYNNADSRTVVGPELPEGKEEEFRKTALKIYKACDCFGMARVDFFLEEGTNRVVFNEINAIPGHTSISMYPMLMERAGRPMKEYVPELIEMAYERN